MREILARNLFLSMSFLFGIFFINTFEINKLGYSMILFQGLQTYCCKCSTTDIIGLQAAPLALVPISMSNLRMYNRRHAWCHLRDWS